VRLHPALLLLLPACSLWGLRQRRQQQRTLPRLCFLLAEQAARWSPCTHSPRLLTASSHGGPPLQHHAIDHCP